jgi:hypothetical protein
MMAASPFDMHLVAKLAFQCDLVLLYPLTGLLSTYRTRALFLPQPSRPKRVENRAVV